MRIITRAESGIPVKVTKSNGRPRPALQRGLRTLTLHYTGASGRLTGRDSKRAFLGLHAFAIKEKKPYEYNYVITQDGQIWEFAGLFVAAHCTGANETAIGVQFHNAVGEPLLDVQLAAYRFLRGHLVAVGALAPDHAVEKHLEMPAAATDCPGFAIEQRWGELDTSLDNVPTVISAEGGDELTGPATVAADGAVAWAIGRGAPADLAGDVVPLYWELAPPLGIRPEVALAQAMVETANFTFPRREHTVSPEHRNPCGMRTRVIEKGPNGEAETPQNHQRFATWRDGVQAHLDHLGLYLGLPGYPKAATPDPRHFPHLLGKVISLTNLGDWWVLGGQGTKPAYGAAIRARVAEMPAAPAAGTTTTATTTTTTATTTTTTPTTSGEEFDMATTADLETVIRAVLNGATGNGLTSYDDTIREILEIGRINFNDLQALKAEVAALKAQLPAA